MSKPGPRAAAHEGATPGQPSSRVVLTVCIIAAAQLLLVLLFAWSSSRSTPHDLPFAVAGPKPAVDSLVQGLEQTQPGAFTVTKLADDAAARAAVTDRKVYGALSLSKTGATLYTAAAASPAVAQALTQSIPPALKQGLPQAVVTVTDLVPNPADDPHGASLPTALIPITLASVAAGAVIGLLAGTRRLRLAALAMYAVLTGTLSTLAIQTLVGGLTGSWLSNAAVITLAALAIASAATGLVAVAGPAGAVVSALVVFFVGFPFSGATTAWQLVPTPWGQLAQYLPVGATNTALRSVAFFDGAASAASLTVLALWGAVGLGLSLLTGRRLEPVG